MTVLSSMFRFCPLVIPACLPIVLAIVTRSPLAHARMDEKDAPVIQLRGKVILPDGVDRRDLVCELVERASDRAWDFEVIPIKITDDLTFETRTKGLSYRTFIIVRSVDRKWKGSWLCIRHELLSKSAEEIVLKLVPVKLRSVQITYDSTPLAGAVVFVMDEFNVAPLKSDRDGIVWFDTRDGYKSVYLAAMANDRLVAWPDYVTFPNDGSPFQLNLKPWEREPVQVVGTDGKPIANIEIACYGFGRKKPSVEPSTQSFYSRSDTNGLTTPMLYSDERMSFEVISPNIRFVTFNKSTKPHRVVVAPVQPDVEVRGKLDLPHGIGEGLLLSGVSSQNDEPNSTSHFECRVHGDGSYVAAVHPEYTYSMFVEDGTWVSSPWSGILASSKPDLAKPLSLDIVQGELVEVVVTRGKDVRPATGVWVYFSQRYDYTFTDEGKERSASGGRRWSSYTDEDGVASTRAGPGELELYVSEDDWKEEAKGIVRPGETTVLTLHHEEPESIAFEGHVKMMTSIESQIVKAQISIDLYLYDVYRSTAKLVVDNNGRFQGKAAKPRVALLARTKDRKYCGVQVADLESGNSEPLVIELHPSASIAGRILDPDGFALPDVEVSFATCPLIRWPKKEPFGGTGFHTESFHTTTDKGGRYLFENVCSRVPSALFVSYRDNSHSTTVLNDNTLEPPTAFVPTVVMPEAEMHSRPLPTRIKNRIDSSKLLNTNAVLIYHGSDKSAIDMAKGLFGRVSFEATRDLSPLVISDSAMKMDAANAAWLKEQGWGLSNDQEILVVLFDQAGQPIVSKRIQATDNITSIAEIIERKQLQLVEQSWDAPSRFDNALESARRTGRDVWISFISIRNPASMAMLRWQDENRKELEKHFVLIHIDWIRDDKGDAVLDRYSINRKESTDLVSVLVDRDGVLLHNTTGESPYKEMQPFQFIDRDRIEALMKAASHPIEAQQWKTLFDSL